MSAGRGGRGAQHGYGDRVHVFDDAWTLSALARIGSPDVGHGELLGLVRAYYHRVAISSFGRELPTFDGEVETRMAEHHPAAGVYRGRLLDRAASVVVIDIIRGGIVPAQVCFELLTGVLSIEAVRLDHLNMSRRADDDGRVVGVDLGGSKIGGTVQGATVVIPDPMGATGTSVIGAIDHLCERYGEPSRIILLPMISTPEFLRAVLDHRGSTVVYTGRVDRGLSDPEALAAPPGTFWDRERGLDERGYIVPGAGGVGEVLNNSWC